MSSATSRGYPFQAVTDRPHGPDLGEDLAQAINADVQAIANRLAVVEAQGKGVLERVSSTSSVGPTVGAGELTIITAGAVVVPANRLLLVEFYCRALSGTNAGDIFEVRIKEGGTVLADAVFTPPGTSLTGIGNHIQAEVTPSAASHTYLATIIRIAGTGTATVQATATSPIRLRVVDMGAA